MNDRIKNAVAGAAGWYNTCCKIAIEQNGKRCPVCSSNLPYWSEAKDLRLGDIVTTSRGTEPYTYATVVKISDKQVTLFRPYVHTSDFTYTGGVIPYMGFEQFEIWLDSIVRVVQESHVQDVKKNETDEGRLIRSGEAERRRERAHQDRLTEQLAAAREK